MAYPLLCLVRKTAPNTGLLLYAPGLRHEQLWRRWFESARSVVPLHAVQVSHWCMSRWLPAGPGLCTPSSASCLSTSSHHEFDPSQGVINAANTYVKWTLSFACSWPTRLRLCAVLAVDPWLTQSRKAHGIGVRSSANKLLQLDSRPYILFVDFASMTQPLRASCKNE